ncbi:DUF6931 family protein [Jiella sonneratiae]|uniref:Uncharacterized protein n=1 Tax=Jiella sonneratiae TaxID=2816856 RepID=A0ABS3J7N1_9HYPH|nr:hypothetical protein [Jiella sonneratiae]MBO0905122.1 hypothetical protein [Jiella sonneratiae]
MSEGTGIAQSSPGAAAAPPQGAALPAFAADVFFALPEIGEDMLARPAGETCPQFLAKLAASATPEEAVTFCAYLLPWPAAILWAHRCLLARPAPQAPRDALLVALVAEWLKSPAEGAARDDLRREALAIAGPARPRTPPVWIALGLGWSAGSLSPPDLPPVAPPAFATPRAVNAGILGLLAEVSPGERAATLAEFLSQARRIAAALAAGQGI